MALNREQVLWRLDSLDNHKAVDSTLAHCYHFPERKVVNNFTYSGAELKMNHAGGEELHTR